MCAERAAWADACSQGLVFNNCEAAAELAAHTTHAKEFALALLAVAEVHPRTRTVVRVRGKVGDGKGWERRRGARLQRSGSRPLAACQACPYGSLLGAVSGLLRAELRVTEGRVLFRHNSPCTYAVEHYLHENGSAYLVATLQGFVQGLVADPPLAEVGATLPFLPVLAAEGCAVCSVRRCGDGERG